MSTIQTRTADYQKKVVDYFEEGSAFTHFLGAARLGDSDFLQVFLGANQVDPKWITDAFIQAAYCTAIPSIKMLFKQGVEINSQDDTGRTALHYTLYRPWSEKHLATAETLLELGAAIHIVDKKGNTPYEIAMNCGNQKMKQLFEKFAISK